MQAISQKYCIYWTESYSTNLLVVEFSVVRAVARNPVLGLLPGLFEKILNPRLHMRLVRPIVLIQLLAELVNGQCVQVCLHVGITRLSNHLMRDLTGVSKSEVRQTPHKSLGFLHLGLLMLHH